jgi:DNA mismatch repair protein MutL
LLQRFGFDFETQKNHLILNGVPSCLQEDSILNCVQVINENIGYKEIDKGEIAHYIVLSIAKSTSLNSLKSKSEPETFIERLFQCEDHQYSPNGKKILSTLTLNDIKLKFA